MKGTDPFFTDFDIETYKEWRRLCALHNNVWDQEHHSLARFNANCYRRLAYQKMERDGIIGDWGWYASGVRSTL